MVKPESRQPLHEVKHRASHRKINYSAILLHLLLIAASILMIAPFWWMISAG